MMYTYYGGGSGKIWLDYAHCRGDEESLVYCSHAHWGVIPRYYGHHYDVSILCRPGLILPRRIFMKPRCLLHLLSVCSPIAQYSSRISTFCQNCAMYFSGLSPAS